MSARRITLNMTPKEAEFVMQKMNDDCTRLQAENERLIAVLKKIAKPAIGGKQQQWWAQEALSEFKSLPPLD